MGALDQSWVVVVVENVAVVDMHAKNPNDTKLSL